MAGSLHSWEWSGRVCDRGSGADGGRCAVRYNGAVTRLLAGGRPWTRLISQESPQGVGGLTEEQLIDAEVPARLMAPGKLLLDPDSPACTHAGSTLLVVEEGDQFACVVVNAVRCCVNRRLAG